MSDTESLDLRSVTERFTESSHVLDQLRERLQGLVLAEDTQGRAARALDTSAEQLASLVASVQAMVEQLMASQATVEGALDAVRRALESSDVNRVAEQLAQIRDDLNGFRELAAAAQADAAQARGESASVRDELATARADGDASRRRLAELEAKLVNVPPRARRKAGIH